MSARRTWRVFDPSDSCKSTALTASHSDMSNDTRSGGCKRSDRIHGDIRFLEFEEISKCNFWKGCVSGRTLLKRRVSGVIH